MHPARLVSPRTTNPALPATPLTKQEANVLQLLAEGLSSNDIGASLGLAPTTVRNYVSNILTKLGLSSRTQAALLAAQLREHPLPAARPASDDR